MRKTLSLTAAQLIEARRLIIRSGRQDNGRRGAAPAPAPAPATASSGDESDALRCNQVSLTARANDPTNAQWRQTEWSETAFEPKG
jgi:hypothetical protein